MKESLRQSLNKLDLPTLTEAAEIYAADYARRHNFALSAGLVNDLGRNWGLTKQESEQCVERLSRDRDKVREVMLRGLDLLVAEDPAEIAALQSSIAASGLKQGVVETGMAVVTLLVVLQMLLNSHRSERPIKVTSEETRPDGSSTHTTTEYPPQPKSLELVFDFLKGLFGKKD